MQAKETNKKSTKQPDKVHNKSTKNKRVKDGIL
jgi:hypothetical protein